MAVKDKNAVGIFGRKGDPAFSFFADALGKISEVTYLDENSSAIDIKEIILPITFPFPHKSKLAKFNSIPKLGVVFDGLAIDVMVDVIHECKRIICFSSQIKNKLLTVGVANSKIEMMPYPLKEINLGYGNGVKTREITKILVPGRRLKNDQVDTLISFLYLSKSNSKNVEVFCFGTELDQTNQGFSKYFIDAVEQKGFSPIVKMLGIDFLSPKAENYKASADCTILFNCNEQNQVETLQYLSDSVSHAIPVLIDMQLFQTEMLAGVCLFKTGEKEVVSQELFKTVYSQNLLDSLRRDLGPGSPIYSNWISDWSNLLDVSVNKASNANDELVLLEDLVAEESLNEKGPALITLSHSIPKVLMMNRSNAFTQPGGDTVVMQRIIDMHSKDLIDLEVCVDGSKSPVDYDLAHLFNFAIKEVTQEHARISKENGVPYVVTTLYEDWPVFYNQMATMYLALKAYVEHGQPSVNWQDYEDAGRKVEPSIAWDNSYAANNAACLIATGSAEEQSLRRDYSQSNKIISIPLGCEVIDYFDGGDLFRKKYGLSEFVLCVGRLEWRKNQLMLLKALEDIDVPLVFAGSSFTYQPEYEALCRAFQRKGKTVFLSRLTDEELASAYQAASAHVLPSWYELPGLVSLEAARYGTPVVASDRGTTIDYLGELAEYCSPSSASSIKNAVLKTLEMPKSELLANKVKEFTWEKAVSEYTLNYLETLDNVSETDQVQIPPVSDLPVKCGQDVIEVKTESVENTEIDTLSMRADTPDFCEIGDSLFKQGNYRQAKEEYLKAVKNKVQASRGNRSLGALSLYLKEFDIAENYFKLALEIDPTDAKALLGKGAVLWERGKKHEAFSLYRQASDLKPYDQSAILYLVNSAYEIDALNELEDCLRRYLRQESSNINIQYCLAGCYFKQEKYSAALGVLERMLTLEPKNKDGIELKSIINEKLEKSQIKSSQSTSSFTVPVAAPVTPSILNSKVMNGSLLTGSSELAALEELKSARQYETLVNRVNILLADERYCDTALDHFDILKAESLGCLGKISEAREILEELRSRNVQLTRVLSDLGALALAGQNSHAAAVLFEESLSHDKNNDTAFSGLAMCAQLEGRLEDAWTLFEEALKRNLQNIQAIYGLVQLGYEFNRLDKVEGFLKEYLELKPIDISILYSLAGCLYAQGKANEAVGELKNILLFDPKNEPALELMEKIETENAQQSC